MSAKVKEKVFRGLMVGCAGLVIGLLLLLLGFVVVKGAGQLDWHFFSADFDDKSAYVEFENTGDLGIKVEVIDFDRSQYLEVTKVNKNSPVIYGEISNGEVFGVKKGDIIKKINSTDFKEATPEDFDAFNASLGAEHVKMKITRPGGGIFPLMVNTVYMILLALVIALPISVFSAMFLAEYAKKNKFLKFIRFATGCLAGIPSIIYGLFGMLVFVTWLNMDFSLVAGACTLAIVLLPILIGQTEEALLRVPLALREGSYALGRTKLQTIFRIVLPNSISGIMIGVLLSIGRIVAESAALLLTAGTVARIPGSMLEGASTLTVRTYIVAKETGDIKLACAMGIVGIVLIVVVNLATRIVERYDKMRLM